MAKSRGKSRDMAQGQRDRASPRTPLRADPGGGNAEVERAMCEMRLERWAGAGESGLRRSLSIRVATVQGSEQKHC